MKTFRTILVAACVGGMTLAAGCAGHGRDALYQPMDTNYANPGDPLERQIEAERSLEARGRVEAPVQTVPEPDLQPPEAPEADDDE